MNETGLRRIVAPFLSLLILIELLLWNRKERQNAVDIYFSNHLRFQWVNDLLRYNKFSLYANMPANTV